MDRGLLNLSPYLLNHVVIIYLESHLVLRWRGWSGSFLKMRPLATTRSVLKVTSALTAWFSWLVACPVGVETASCIIFITATHSSSGSKFTQMFPLLPYLHRCILLTKSLGDVRSKVNVYQIALVCIYPNLLPKVRCDTRSNFKQNKA